VNTSPSGVNVTTESDVVQVNGQDARLVAAAPGCLDGAVAPPRSLDLSILCPALSEINRDTATYPLDVGENAAWISCNVCPAGDRGTVRCDGAPAPPSRDATQVNVAPSGQSGSQVNSAPPGASNVSQVNVIGRRRRLRAADDLFAACASANALWSADGGETGDRAARLFCQLGCGASCAADLEAIEAAHGKLVSCPAPPPPGQSVSASGDTLVAQNNGQAVVLGPGGISATMGGMTVSLPRRRALRGARGLPL